MGATAVPHSALEEASAVVSGLFEPCWSSYQVPLARKTDDSLLILIAETAAPVAHP